MGPGYNITVRSVIFFVVVALPGQTALSIEEEQVMTAERESRMRELAAGGMCR